MNAATFKTLRGALKILRRRVTEHKAPGLGIWIDVSSSASIATGRAVQSLAHANECDERGLGADLSKILADGRVDADELDQLKRMPRRIERCAERSHDISEIVS